MLTMPSRPTTVYESVYIRGQALAGNQCPANATSPTKPCDAGYYCPTPARQLSCPEGFYCRQGSQEPAKCPPLVSCPEGSSKASLSWAGFILLIGILVMLWLSYLLTITVLRMKQRRLARTQAARERLWKLLNPLFASQQYSKSQAFRAFKAVRPKLNLEFEDLGLTLHDGLPILSGVTGKFSHSRVAAIMGPSGAGKSTFLSVIMGKAGKYGTVTGHLRVNGREMRADQLRGIVGFVPQEDVVHEDLTVRENLVYSARLRLSAAKPLKEQLAIVDDVINVLQLRHIQHQVVGTAERRGISGGQRKRVNIGCELVSKPSVLFMDEPTSGLDSTAAADILVALKRMAGLGMNIVTVIHQPRYAIFSLFDDVMLLCKGGKLAYQGPSALALSYLESLGFNLPPNENPADFAMDVLSGSVPREGFPGFQPEDLVPIWQGHGYSWTQAQEDAAPSGGIPSANCASLPAHEAVDPQQLRLLEDAFDHADADEDGAIDAAGLRSLLQSLGVEPTSADVQMICTELAEQRSGLITRDDFLQYVRYGGRPPTADTAPVVGGSKRRVDSLYRVYSIEQYSLGAALAELAAAQLPAGLKDGPIGSGLTLKEVAAAVVGSDGTGAVPNAASGPARRTVTMTAMAGPPPVIHEEGEEGYESGEESVGAARTSSSASVRSMRLPSPEEHGAELNVTNATAGEDTGGRQQKESSDLGGRFWKREPISDSRRASTLLAAAPRVPENASRANSTRTTAPPPSRGLGWGLLRLLGLEVGTGRLRQTPGVLGQFLVLTARAGIKYTRNWTVKLMDLMLLIAAALATGAMHGTGSAPQDIRGQTALVMLTLGIISASTSLSVFSRDRLVHWRERDSGISVLPYFLANTLWNLLDVAIYPLVFVAIYQSMTLPSTPFLTYYIVGLLVVWWTTSAGCLISILVGNPSSALVAAVAVVMISGGFVNGVNPNYRDLGTATKRLTSISFNRWAVEGIVIAAYSNYPRYMWPLTKALVNMAGYCGLDSAGIPSIGGSAKGVEDAEHAPPWQETSQQEEGMGGSLLPPLIWERGSNSRLA
jgi:ABC-type multidrug transport system ATPase subunit